MSRTPHLRPRKGRSRPATAAFAAAAVLATLLAGSATGPAAAADEPAPVLIDRFEGEVPLGNNPPADAIFTWGGDADDHPRLELAERADAPEGEQVLEGSYDISAYGGFSHEFAVDTPPQNWTAHKGIRFWWYGRNTAPLPPGSGKRINFEIKDGGANGGASELWTTSFTDDWEGWHLVEIPFADFVYRADYQPVGGIDQILGLNEMWGYALTLPGGAPGEFALDAVELYGKAEPALTASVVTDTAVRPVRNGASAELTLSVATTGSVPTEEPVTVAYATKGGTAEPGKDYTPVTGSHTFPAGTAAGTTHKVTVRTAKASEPAEAKTIPLELTVTGAKAPRENPQVVIDAHGLPYQNAELPVKQRVADLLGRLSLAEKAGQMTQAERNALRAPGDIAAYDLGSLLSGGGSVPTPNTAAAWAKMVDAYQLRAQATRFQIPLIYGVDAVHGHNNVVGATIMPHNIGIGAGRDPKSAERTGAITAREVRSTGVPWDFAPCVCVTRDERWGRSYEAFGEDPALVEAMETVIQGMQGSPSGKDLHRNDKVLGSAKHFVGDGGTAYGSSTTGSYTTDQGITEVTREELEAVHLSPFEESVKRGVGTIMPSYSSLDILGDDQGPVKMHANAEMINGVLKDRMGFEGFVISDWQAIDQIPGDYPSDVRTSVNAGLDMIMVPTAYQDFTKTLKDEVAAGRISEARVDDAVARILTQKFRLGLFEKPYADTTHLDKVGSAGVPPRPLREAVRGHHPPRQGRLGRTPCGGAGGGGEVAGAPEERRGRPSAQAGPEGVRRRVQRRRPRQPGRRLDDQLAGLLREDHRRHDDPGGDEEGGEEPGVRHLLPRRLRRHGRLRRRCGGRRRDPVRRGHRGRRQRPRPGADGGRQGSRGQGLRGHEVRRPHRLRPPPAHRRPARQDQRAGGLLAAGLRGRRRRRCPLRQARLHRTAAGDLAEVGCPAPDQRRGRGLRPAVPLRLGADHLEEAPGRR